MNDIKKQTPHGRVSRFTRSEIDLLFKNGKAVYKSKEFVILTTPCYFLRRCGSQLFAVTSIPQNEPCSGIAPQQDTRISCPEETGRILLITSRKVGNAPERNLLRRRGRAIFYEEKLFELGKHCVVIFKAPAKQLSFDQFKEILKKAVASSYAKAPADKQTE